MGPQVNRRPAWASHGAGHILDQHELHTASMPADEPDVAHEIAAALLPISHLSVMAWLTTLDCVRLSSVFPSAT